MNETFLIDTHSHINMIEDLSIDEVLENASVNHVKKIIVPAASTADIDEVYNLSQKYENVYCYLGIHPEDAKIGVTGLLTKSEFMHSRQKF